MKRILTSIAFLSSFSLASQAQSSTGPIDLQALIALPAANSTLNGFGTLDTNNILCGIRCNTNDSITNTQSIIFYSSFNNFPTPTTVNASGFSFTDDQLFEDSAIIFIFPNANELGAGHVSPFKLGADSIKALCNWADWENDIFTTINRADLVAGQEYGFFFKVLGIQDEESGTDEYREDPVQGGGAHNGNNRTAVKVKWNPNATGIGEMLVKKDKVNISVYPNPASDQIHFTFNFPKNSHATAVVRDITGKMVLSNNYGRTMAGKQEFSMNTARLSKGVYILQFDTDDQVAVAKFTVK